MVSNWSKWCITWECEDCDMGEKAYRLQKLNNFYVTLGEPSALISLHLNSVNVARKAIGKFSSAQTIQIQDWGA